MIPTEQTKDQAAASQSPTSFSVNLPGDGIYKSGFDGSQFTIRQGDSVFQTGLQDLGRQYAQSIGKGFEAEQSGAVAQNYGRQYLQSIGADINTLPSLSDAQMADFLGAVTRGTGGLAFSKTGDLGSIANLFKTKSTSGTTATYNTEKNQLATPEQLAASGAATKTALAANTIQSTAPGGNAKNLFEYYSQKGEGLPPLADRGALFEQMGLGSASGYTGSAQQNEQLLQKLQLNDYSKSTFGSTIANPAVNATPAGSSLSAALSGRSAEETLSNYRTVLASSLGIAENRLASSEKALDSFYSSRKSADQILSEELDRRGITQAQTLLSSLDVEIKKQTDLLAKLPENMRTSLADVGVSQAQLDRLVLKESKKPTEILKGLIESRNGMSTQMNETLKWAEKFADTRVADQTARLAALQWEVTHDTGMYKDLSDDAKQLALKSIDEKMKIYDTAKSAAENGASGATIDKILASGSYADAIRAAGSSLVNPKNTSATTAITNDVKEAGSALELGLSDKGYNGRGADGYVDPNLYVALYNQAQAMYGSAGAAAFLDKYPPGTSINPANVGSGLLPSPIENAVQAYQSKKSQTVVIDSALIQSALSGN